MGTGSCCRAMEKRSREIRRASGNFRKPGAYITLGQSVPRKRCTMRASVPGLLLCLSVTGMVSATLTGCTNMCGGPPLHRASFSPDSGPVHIHHMGGDID